ncbi:MAG: GNAT family N-acetyltransferase [Luteimonas sp.]
MHAPPVLRVVPATPDLADQVRALRVTPDQVKYVGNFAFNLEDALRDPSSEAIVVLADDEAIGFYRLDFAPRAVIGRTLGAPSVGVRAFGIGRQFQGRGLGTRAALAMCADLQLRHPDRRLVVLAVNCSNRMAVSAYRNAGFIDTGQLFAGGSAGPQHVMLHALGKRVGQSPHADTPSTLS